MIGIIGGGFGLYGWLPALCQYYPKENIAIEKRHKEKFDKRSELQQYKNRIYWVDSIDRESYIINNVELLILAIPPNQTFNYLNRILNSPYSLKKIIVEKPICETPEKSEQFIKAIEDKGIKICSSYLFLYTDWFKNLDKSQLTLIRWYKNNLNPSNSWKHDPSLGGGDIFYKIHLLSLKTQFSLLMNCEFDGKSNINKFHIINQYGSLIYDGPFPNQIKNEEDVRIPYLKELLYDFENNYDKVNLIMKQTNQLWKQEKLKSN